LSSRQWQHPVTGAPLRFAKSTLERWYHLARREPQDPFTVLKTRIRVDAGRYRALSPGLIEALHTQYRAHPSWSIQLHYENLRVLLKDEAPFPSYNTVRSYFRANGLRKLPRHGRPTEEIKQFVPREIRSFEADFANGLWHLDFHECSRSVLTKKDAWVKPVALCIMDDRSRIVCHIQWAWSETTQDLVHGFTQALMRRGLPRSLLTDNGSAMIAKEFTNGLETLGITHYTTLPRAAWQNGKQEAMWASVEGRLIAMLDNVRELDLDLLNRATHAWIELDYQHRRHDELDCSPLERYRQGPDCGPTIAGPASRRCASASSCTSTAS
jgi:transposase InsO family protein